MITASGNTTGSFIDPMYSGANYLFAPDHNDDSFKEEGTLDDPIPNCNHLATNLKQTAISQQWGATLRGHLSAPAK